MADKAYTRYRAVELMRQTGVNIPLPTGTNANRAATKSFVNGYNGTSGLIITWTKSRSNNEVVFPGDFNVNAPNLLTIQTNFGGSIIPLDTNVSDLRFGRLYMINILNSNYVDIITKYDGSTINPNNLQYQIISSSGTGSAAGFNISNSGHLYIANINTLNNIINQQGEGNYRNVDFKVKIRVTYNQFSADKEIRFRIEGDYVEYVLTNNFFVNKHFGYFLNESAMGTATSDRNFIPGVIRSNKSITTDYLYTTEYETDPNGHYMCRLVLPRGLYDYEYDIDFERTGTGTDLSFTSIGLFSALEPQGSGSIGRPITWDPMYTTSSNLVYISNRIFRYDSSQGSLRIDLKSLKGFGAVINETHQLYVGLSKTLYGNNGQPEGARSQKCIKFNNKFTFIYMGYA